MSYVALVYSSTYVCSTASPQTHYVTNQSFEPLLPKTRLSTRDICFTTCGPCRVDDDEYIGYRSWCHPSREQIETFGLQQVEEGEWDEISVDQSYGYYKGHPSHPFIFSTYLCYGKHQTKKKVWYPKQYDKGKNVVTPIIFQMPRGL